MPTINRGSVDPAFDEAAAERDAAIAATAAKAAEEAANIAAATEAARAAEAAANAAADAERQAAIDVEAAKAAEEAANAAQSDATTDTDATNGAANGDGPMAPVDDAAGGESEPSAEGRGPGAEARGPGADPGDAGFSPPRRWSESGASHAAEAAFTGTATADEREERMPGADPGGNAAPADQAADGQEDASVDRVERQDPFDAMAGAGSSMGEEHGANGDHGRGDGPHARPEAAGHGDPSDEMGEA